MVNKMLVGAFIVIVAVTTGLSSASPDVENVPEGFVHGIIVNVDGEDYRLATPPGVVDNDIPGHYWNIAGENHLVGMHYNVGPDGAPNWWSSGPDGADNGELLYVVDGIIDNSSAEKGELYAKIGYVHHHPIIKVTDGSKHPTKVLWLKHTARTSFYLNGGPPGHDHLWHWVTPGVDYNMTEP